MIAKAQIKPLTPEYITVDTKVWVPFKGHSIAGVVLEKLTYGDYIVMVRGKKYQYEASQVKRCLL
ncbi:hypothetical protein ACFL27_09435 [candidate division CSSED10-310 bacterium]|uniref:Uncharacterized protein n=1 Tax=candidate division CSSED10-310 bacterium TaxID=2855610 RepID=A0ABV6YW21_UNCC1